MKYGFIKDNITRDNYVFGGLSSVPKIVLQEDGQWDNFLPQRELQNINFETCNCTAFGTSSAVEMIMDRKFGIKVNYSDRALGIVSGTYPPGNSAHKVAESLRSKGLLPEELLPFSQTLKTVDDYYQPNPLSTDLSDKAKEWGYIFMHEWVDQKDIKECLKYSPLGVAVNAWNLKDGVYVKDGEDNHWTVIYGFDDQKKAWKIFDSYDNSLKLYSYDNKIEYIKRYFVDKSEQEIKRNIIIELLRLMGEYLGILKKEEMNDKLQKIYDTGKANLGKYLSLNHAVPRTLNCAQSISYVLKQCGYPIPPKGLDGTAGLFDWLNVNFTRVTTPSKGSIIINVTGTGKTGSRGHVGIVGEKAIMSNSSQSGTFEPYWSMKAWLEYYEKQNKMKTYYFNPK